MIKFYSSFQDVFWVLDFISQEIDRKRGEREREGRKDNTTGTLRDIPLLTPCCFIDWMNVQLHVYSHEHVEKVAARRTL